MSSVSPTSTDGRAEGRGGLRAGVSRSALRLQSDRRLVALTRAGSGVAFSVIVERYRAPLLTYTRRLLGPDEAQDALQQTFVNALAALRRDDRDVEVRPWLYRIAHNVAVNALRRSGRHYEQLDDQFDGVPQPPDILDRKLRVERLIEGIGRLPERQREAIVAHELEGRSYEEIAHSMSATTPVVRQLVHRARTRLRDACGVVVPAWALRWLAVEDLRAAGSERVGEALGGGAAGAGLLKAGTALLATGAIATGAGGLVAGHDTKRAREGHASAAAHSTGVAAPSAPKSSTQALQAHVIAARPHAKRVSSKSPGHHGSGRSGEHHHSGNEGGGSGNSGHAKGPQRRPGEANGNHGSDGSGSGDTHEASHDGSGDHHGDGSGSGGGDSHSGNSGGDSHSGGSADRSGSPDGSDQPGAPSPPGTPPVGTTGP